MRAAILPRIALWRAGLVPGIAAALFLAGLLTHAPAQAQSGEGGQITMPEDGTPGLSQVLDAADIDVRVDPMRRQARADEEVQGSTEHSWISPLRLTDLRYPAQNGILRITGEREWVSFDLYSVASDVDAVLQIASVSGINNLPERSRMHLSVNGQEVGTQNLTHLDTVGTDQFTIPAGLLQSGRNRVQIEFRQQHRIFCGPEASFDLWTDIDLSRSGLVVRSDSDALRANLLGMDGFLMALAAQSSGGRSVEIRGIDTLGSEAEDWRDFLVARFNQVLAGTPLLFSFTGYWTTQPDTRVQARITILPASESRIRFVLAGDGAVVMVLEVAQGDRPEQLLSGIHAVEAQEQDMRPPQIVTELDVPFSDFGVESESFSQRYANRDHAFRLPDDWLVLTAAKARIHLDYAYAPDLPQGAMLLLKINGTAVRLLPLRGEGGALISRFPVDFEARLMHPGTNILSFEMFVPGNPPTLPCAANEAPILQISGSSSLHVPFSASMYIPDMDFAFTALSPDSLSLNEMSGRAYSQMDVLTLKAALARTRAGIRPSKLHLISLDDLGSIPTGHYNADRRLLEDAVLLPDQTGTHVAEPGSDGQGDPFQMRRSEQRSVSLAFSAGVDAALEQGRWMFERVFPRSGDQLNTWLAQQRGQAVLFQLDPARPDEIWMLRGPDSDMHAIAHAVANARVHGGGPRGQVSVLTHEGQWESWLAPDRRPLLLEPWSRQNFRSAMGNIVSAQPIFYTILILGLAVLSGMVALRLVISTREHKT